MLQAILQNSIPLPGRPWRVPILGDLVVVVVVFVYIYLFLLAVLVGLRSLVLSCPVVSLPGEEWMGVGVRRNGAGLDRTGQDTAGKGEGG